ncbi:MAG: sugar-transfer associated ATP-grasp domain-containing protein [Candidatus Moranbacteria bacterium]|nr:sugar-transfer associated ATP-grasp domain-containing protein [Candidatus Moranbacteria bacterium]
MFDFFKQSNRLLGMNARNLEYIRPHNRKRGMEMADSKLLCKRVLKKNSLAAPALIAKIKNREELEAFDWNTLPDSFALKPNRGFGGEGILVVYARKKGRLDAWVKADGAIITVEDLHAHISNIFDGSFSLANSPDIAFFEERLKLLKLFKPYSFKGIPDIRVIVFNRVPVMAMLRLPTRASDGKANLQQGAIGVGIDLATGTTTTAIIGKGHIIEYIPGTRLVLSGIKIPYWKEILRMSVEAQTISGLGFLGADISIDRDRGPVILELNARPGLSIQLANLAGLKDRLKRVSGLKIKTTERGMRVGMNLFGGEIEEEIEELSGKRVIGSTEKIKLIGKDGKEIEVEAKIDTGADSTSIDTELAKELGFGDVLKFFETIPKPLSTNREELRVLSDEYDAKYRSAHSDLQAITFTYSANGLSMRPKIEISLLIDSLTIPARVTVVDRASLEYPVIIGRKNLQKFLVDVSK